MIKVVDGVVIKPPKNGFLSDGRAVSGYEWLDEETLRKEGWKDEVKDKG